MLPWRSEDVNDNCRIANQDECRPVYHGDFNCESGKDLTLDWWAEQMDLHSVKITEIERLSNLKDRIWNFLGFLGVMRWAQLDFSFTRDYC